MHQFFQNKLNKIFAGILFNSTAPEFGLLICPNRFYSRAKSQFLGIAWHGTNMISGTAYFNKIERANNHVCGKLDVFYNQYAEFTLNPGVAHT